MITIPGAVGKIWGVLARFPEHAGVARSVFELTATLTKFGHDMSEHESAETIESICRAMRAHPTNIELQRGATKALITMASSEETIALMLRYGVVDLDLHNVTEHTSEVRYASVV